MKPATKRKFLAVIAFITLANVLDLLSTYVVSPNLAEEWNVLQRVYGLGWPGLLAAKLLGGTLAILGYWYYLRHRRACYPPPGASFRTFCRAFAYGHSPDILAAHDHCSTGGVIENPAEDSVSARAEASEVGRSCEAGRWTHLIVNLGYFWAGMQALVVWVAIENMLLGVGIAVPLRAWWETGYHMLQSGVVGGLVLVRFFVGNYRRYQRITAPGSGVHPADDTAGAPLAAQTFDKPVRLC